MTNWTKDGGVATEPPGANDDVELNGTPGLEFRSSNVDRAFMINTIKMTANFDSSVFLDGDLDIVGNGSSSIASGMIKDLLGGHKVRFFTNDFAILNWSGGGFDADVEISTICSVNITGTNEKRSLRDFDSSAVISWDGLGLIRLGSGVISLVRLGSRTLAA